MAPPRGLRLPTAGFETILRILRAYLSAAKNEAGTSVRLDDVVKRAGGARTLVSAQNAFLASLGLIEGGNAKRLTDRGRRLALAADHPDTPEWHEAWSEVVENSEELAGVVDSVRIRREMTQDDLVSHIVLTAGVPKNASSLRGARTVLEILKAAGAINESDGTFRPVASVDTPEPKTSTGGEPLRQPIASPSPSEAPQGIPAGGHTSAVTVHVHVWVGGADEDDLPERIRAIIEKLTSDS